MSSEDPSGVGALVADLKRALAGVPPQRVVVLCVGNEMRGDDGFARAVARELGSACASRVFDGGQAPENELPCVARLSPEAVVLVDAVDFGAPPGTLRILDPDALREDGFDTHTASLSLAAKFLFKSSVRVVIVLAAQPLKVELGDVMSPEVSGAATTAAKALSSLLT